MVQGKRKMQRLLTSSRTGTTSMPARARTRTEAAYLLSERRKDEMLAEQEELLRECRQGFDAIFAGAEASRNLLRIWRVVQTPGQTPQETMCDYMHEQIRVALGDEK